MTSVVRIAAVGDVHVGLDTGPVLGPPEQLAESADLLLVAGDLTRGARRPRPTVLAAELRHGVGAGRSPSSATTTTRATPPTRCATSSRRPAPPCSTAARRRSTSATSASASPARPGFGGGFQGASCSEFGEPLMKAFVAHTRAMADGAVPVARRSWTPTCAIAMTHYSPIEATLGRRAAGDLPVPRQLPAGRGHRHRRRPPRRPRPRPPRAPRRRRRVCGVPVRNVAQPLLGRPYTVLHLSTEGLADGHA